MDTTGTDHPPDKLSHPTPRALDLRERPDSAAEEGLSAEVSRFLRFLGERIVTDLDTGAATLDVSELESV